MSEKSSSIIEINSQQSDVTVEIKQDLALPECQPRLAEQQSHVSRTSSFEQESKLNDNGQPFSPIPQAQAVAQPASKIQSIVTVIAKVGLAIGLVAGLFYLYKRIKD